MVGFGVSDAFILLIGFAIWAAVAWLLSKVFARTGMTPALSLLIFVPYAGVFIVLYLLAYSAWPVLDACKDSSASDGQ